MSSNEKTDIKTILGLAKRIGALCQDQQVPPVIAANDKPDFNLPDVSTWPMPEAMRPALRPVLVRALNEHQSQYRALFDETVGQMASVQDLGGSSDVETAKRLCRLFEKKWAEQVNALLSAVTGKLATMASPVMLDETVSKVGGFPPVSPA